MTDLLKLQDLLPGDILLYRGKHVVSKLIRIFDSGNYNHAGIFSGQPGRKAFVEALAPGIVSHSLEETSEGNKYIHIYRFQRQGKTLGTEEYPVEPILERIEHYRNLAPNYGYTDLLLLASIIHTRKIPRFVDGGLLKRVLESAARWIDKKLKGRDAMICSSFVYRCFEEADTKTHKYQLDVERVTHSNSEKILGKGDLLSVPVSDSAINMATPEIESLEKAIDDDVWAVNSHDMSSDKVAQIMKKLAIDNFVTPNDLSRCQDLTLVGALEFAGAVQKIAEEEFLSAKFQERALA